MSLFSVSLIAKIQFKSSRIEFTFITYFVQTKLSALIRKLSEALIKQAVYSYITLREIC